MQFAGEKEIGFPKNVVVEFFENPSKVVDCIPGIESYDVKGSEFKAKVKFKIGAISGAFGIEGKIETKKPGEEYVIYLKGKKLGAGFEATSTCTLVPKDENTTIVKYVTDLKLSGMLAAIGKGIIENVANNIVDQLLENIRKKLGSA